MPERLDTLPNYRSTITFDDDKSRPVDTVIEHMPAPSVKNIDTITHTSNPHQFVEAFRDEVLQMTKVYGGDTPPGLSALAAAKIWQSVANVTKGTTEVNSPIFVIVGMMHGWNDRALEQGRNPSGENVPSALYGPFSALTPKFVNRLVAHDPILYGQGLLHSLVRVKDFITSDQYKPEIMNDVEATFLKDLVLFEGNKRLSSIVN